MAPDRVRSRHFAAFSVPSPPFARPPRRASAGIESQAPIGDYPTLDYQPQKRHRFRDRPGSDRQRGSAVLACLLAALFSLLGFQAFRLPSLHGAIMRMRFLVVFAARTAEEEQNFLGILSHDELPRGAGRRT
jgi:hypothetical protein